MAHFFGKLQGNRGPTTRCGTKESGIRVKLNGWNFGIEILIFHRDGKDYAHVWQTDGSSSKSLKKYIVTLTRCDTKESGFNDNLEVKA